MGNMSNMSIFVILKDLNERDIVINVSEISTIQDNSGINPNFSRLCEEKSRLLSEIEEAQNTNNHKLESKLVDEYSRICIEIDLETNIKIESAIITMNNGTTFIVQGSASSIIRESMMSNVYKFKY